MNTIQVRKDRFSSIGWRLGAISMLIWAAILPAQATVSPFILVQGRQLRYHGQRYFLNGVNYYPQRTPWSQFWPQYNPQVIAQDFARIQSLGFNTVRIFVPYASFGGPNINPVFMSRLHDLLGHAGKHRLKVIVTLFDFFTDYGKLAESKQHVRQLVSPLAHHPAILAWDLKNEGDSDYKYGKSKVIQWIQQMAVTVRQWDHQHLITAGWSAPEPVPDVAPFLDYVTFHYYRDEGQLAVAINRLKQQVHKPIVVGEYGFHTWEHSPPDPHVPEHQYNYFNAVQAALFKTDIAGSMVWNLYDYAPQLREPHVLMGESVQYHMGIIDSHGQLKHGVRALTQAAFLVDAKTGRAIDGRTQQVELVFRLSQSGPVKLLLHVGQKSTLLQSFSGKVGLNQFRWAVAPSLLQDLIYLRKKYEIQAKFLVKINGAPYPVGSQYLQLREK